MPGIHCIAGCRAEIDALLTRILSTCSVGYVDTFEWDRPVNAMDFPMNELSQRTAGEQMDYDGMVAVLSANGPNYWIARIYGNYNNELDMYVRFGLLPGRVYHYELFVPKYRYAGRAIDETGFYADPRLWYYAERKVFVRGYSEAEFADYWDSMSAITAAIEAAEDPPADGAIADDEAIAVVATDGAIGDDATIGVSDPAIGGASSMGT